MRQLYSITRSLPLQPIRSSLRTPRAIAPVLPTLSNSNRYSTTTETARPKILDPTDMNYESGSQDVKKHNKEFERRGEGGSPGKVSDGKGEKPGPKIHNTAGVFDGEKRDVERHNREFKERHDRGE